MTSIIKITNPPTPITLNVSSSMDNVLADALSGTLELGDGPAEDDAETPALPELPLCREYPLYFLTAP